MLPILIAATIITNTSSASVDTGGNHASPGGTVVTGSASASNKIYNYSNEDGGQTTTHTHIEVNGEVYDEETTTPIVPGVPVINNVHVTATGTVTTSSAPASTSQPLVHKKITVPKVFTAAMEVIRNILAFLSSIW